MQNIKTLQKEIDELRNFYKGFNKHDSAYKKALKRIQFLRDCIMYIESEPRKEFIEKQLASLTKKLDRINNGFDDWYKIQQAPRQKTEQEWLREYNSFMGKSHIENQIKNIQFILS